LIDDSQITDAIARDVNRGARLLYEKYQRPLLQIAQRVFGASEEDAEEAVQDCLLKAFLKIQTKLFVPTTPHGMRPWLVTILKNQIIDMRRKEGNDRIRANSMAYEEEYPDDNDFAGLPASAKATAKHLVNLFSPPSIGVDERTAILERIFQCFNLDEQVTLRSYFNNDSHNEIAAQLGKEPETSKRYVNRLVIRFFDKAGEILKTDGTIIHENWKAQNSKGIATSDAGEPASRT
jgi:RNA polymerase sigma factor (sigma-70 family)